MKYLASLICALLICAAAHAAAPSKESIEKLLVVTEVEKLLVTMQQQLDVVMQTGLAQAFRGQTLSPEAQQITESHRSQMAAMLKAELSWEKMKDLYIQVYG